MDAWLRSVLWENVLPGHAETSGPVFEIHRLKGRLFLREGGEKMVQGVRELFDIFDSPSPSSAEQGEQQGKLVLIGRHLGEFDFQRSLMRAMEEAR